MIEIPHDITLEKKYGPAMQITTQAEADEYFEALVQHSMGFHGLDRAKAVEVEKSNLGYWAGYHSNETRYRVEELFQCAHPFFGAIAEKGPPTPEEAFRLGEELAEKRLKDVEDKIQ